MENYVIHMGPVEPTKESLFIFVKNYVIHEKLRDSWKTTWVMKNSLITFSLKEIAPIFGYIFYSRNWYCLYKTDKSKTSCFTFGGRALTYEILV